MFTLPILYGLQNQQMWFIYFCFFFAFLLVLYDCKLNAFAFGLAKASHLNMTHLALENYDVFLRHFDEKIISKKHIFPQFPVGLISC